MDVAPEQVTATLARIKPQLEAQDFEFVERLSNTLLLVVRPVRVQRASIARLRRMFGLTSSEKTRDVAGSASADAPQQQPDNGTGPESAAADGGDAGAEASKPIGAGAEASKRKGHGRLSSSDYPNAIHHAVLHAKLKVGALSLRHGASAQSPRAAAAQPADSVVLVDAMGRAGVACR
jgi:hypothetical protein